jgi:hypothetical protein
MQVRIYIFVSCPPLQGILHVLDRVAEVFLYFVCTRTSSDRKVAEGRKAPPRVWGNGGAVVAGGGRDKAPVRVQGDGGVVMGETRPLLVFGATEGRWWLVVVETGPLFAFEATEGRWWLVVGETSPPLAFEATEGVPAVAVDQNKRITPPLAFGAREGGGSSRR